MNQSSISFLLTLVLLEGICYVRGSCNDQCDGMCCVGNKCQACDNMEDMVDDLVDLGPPWVLPSIAAASALLIVIIIVTCCCCCWVVGHRHPKTKQSESHSTEAAIIGVQRTLTSYDNKQCYVDKNRFPYNNQTMQ